jgi:glucokinase
MLTVNSNAPLFATAATALAAIAMFYFPKLSSSSNTSKETPCPDSTYLMIADIGGTNSRLGLYKPGSIIATFQKEYLNSRFITDPTKTFEKQMFIPFLKESGIDFSDKTIIACYAVAGPVAENCCYMTNLIKNETILLDGKIIEASNDGDLARIKRCKIINDFVGQGYGLLDLDLDTEVVELIPGSKDRMCSIGPKACLGAGTGLGECYLTTSSLHPEEGYECYASEGGHADYSPRSHLEVDLGNYIRDKCDQPNRVSVERVVSGRGLANVYEFLAKTFPEKKTQAIHDEFEAASDMQGRVVGLNANVKEDPCKLCVQAMEIMISGYGAEAGNCCVKFIPTGGLYVSGGLTPKNIDFIKGEDSPFMKAYKDKGRLSELVKSIPLFAVLVEDIGLRGARVCAMRVSVYRLLLLHAHAL